MVLLKNPDDQRLQSYWIIKTLEDQRLQGWITTRRPDLPSDV